MTRKLYARNRIYSNKEGFTSFIGALCTKIYGQGGTIEAIQDSVRELTHTLAELIETFHNNGYLAEQDVLLLLGSPILELSFKDPGSD